MEGWGRGVEKNYTNRDKKNVVTVGVIFFTAPFLGAGSEEGIDKIDIPVELHHDGHPQFFTKVCMNVLSTKRIPSWHVAP